MTSPQIIAIVVIIVVVAAIAAWYGMRRNRTRHLQDHFGPEYQRRLAEVGNKSKAEAELAESEARVRKVHVRTLSESERARFLENWRLCQARFVDDPAGAVMDADRLLSDIMHARGYNVDDVVNRSTDICAAYPAQSVAFREANDIVVRHRRGMASTEDLRKAFIDYRGLFEDILGGTNAKLERAS